MADPINSWMIPKSTGPIDPNEKLFVFGYSCKIFPYDDKAAYIDKGKHLIPWMGDKNLMIDRYDVRGYLHDLKQFEPKPGGYDDSSEEEQLIDEERYQSLRTNMTEQQLYQEEELKRLRAAIASDGAYHEIGFTYDSLENEKQSEPVSTKADSPDDELYKVPEGLKVPKEMEVPYNMKIHAIIEKTAVFVSEQGGQMEIIIKMKQHANPQFAFMHLDNPLYPYYKHLVQEIKSGAYKPIQARRVSRSEDEDDDGHYLHPSLLSGKANVVPKFTVPTINFRRSDDDSYALLVKNLQQHVMEETAPEPEQNTCEGSENNSPLENSNYDVIHNHHIVPPPPDVQPIVNKMAEYVAKNGEDFEIIVKSKNDKRFDFLHPWHEYYNYYIYKRNVARHEIHGTDLPNSEIKLESDSEQKSQMEENNLPSISTENDQNPNITEECSTLITDSETLPIPNISNDENDCLHSQTSQDSVFDLQESSKQDSSNSLDSLNSPSSDATVKDESKPKTAKVIKGPISFSLKVKESEIPTEKSKLTPLLMDDSDDDSSEESRTQKNNMEDTSIANQPKTIVAEQKAPKQIDEAMETKLAEERIKDKLLATARERLAQQRKEKQIELEQQMRAEQQKKEKQQLLDQQRKEKELQLERKRKAALFLKMLKRKSPDLSPAVPAILKTDKNHDGIEASQSPDFWCLPDTSNANSSDNGILFPVDKIIISTQDPHSSVIPGIKTDWSPDHSESSAVEDPLSRITDCPNSDPGSPKIFPIEQSRKKKRKRKSRSISRDRSRRSSKSSHRTKDKCKSRSPPRHYKSEKTKREKEKQLPAAYADVDSSRSRSRSPKRYRSVPKWRRR